jgi:hypothetical protein
MAMSPRPYKGVNIRRNLPSFNKIWRGKEKENQSEN